MAKTVRLWIREDGEEPKAIACDATTAPGPGRIVDVEARSAEDARAVLESAKRELPSEDCDPEGWLTVRLARKRVSEVTS